MDAFRQHLGLRQNFHLSLFEEAGHLPGDVRILEGQNPIGKFDHRHFNAEVIQHGGPLDSDDAAADDDDRAGKLLHLQGVIGIHHITPVHFQAGQGAGAGARGDQQILGNEHFRLSPVLFLHGNRPRLG